MKKIRVGDTVKVKTGNDKGKTGRVLQVKDGRLLVEGVRVVVKHMKGSNFEDKKGRIIKVPSPIDISNVVIVCPKCKKETKAVLTIKGDKKVRQCKKCQEELKVTISKQKENLRQAQVSKKQTAKSKKVEETRLEEAKQVIAESEELEQVKPEVEKKRLFNFGKAKQQSKHDVASRSRV